MRKFKFILVASLFLVSSGFSWQKMHCVEGRCEAVFPNKPEHFNQMIALDDLASFMKVDIYMSDIENSSSLFSLIVTHFPGKIDSAKEQDSLESFLNGMLNSSETKSLKEAKFCEFVGLNALDFLMEDGGRLLKGKVILNEDKLYLLSIEYNEDENIDYLYEKYISSFQIK